MEDAVSTLLEILVLSPLYVWPRRRIAKFQPFLRFWLSIEHVTTHRDEIAVSTLLEILAHLYRRRDEVCQRYVSTLLEILVKKDA